MTRLLRLLNQVFSNPTKGSDLEKYINSRDPYSHQQVEQLTRDFLYRYTISRGL